MIITIDGPAGSGKSTVAKRVADALGFVYFDTGAMYRAVTYGLIAQAIDFHNARLLEEFLKDFSLDIQVSPQGQKQYRWRGADISAEIRSQQVTDKVSEVSAIPAVRHRLVSLQREFGSGRDSVFEGRDMGTVVFPQAELKIFLFANPEARAQRRLVELQRSDQTLSLERVLTDINRRDHYDSNRAHSPLKPAEDAYLIDTSALTIDQVVDQVLACKSRVRPDLL